MAASRAPRRDAPAPGSSVSCSGKPASRALRVATRWAYGPPWTQSSPSWGGRLSGARGCCEQDHVFGTFVTWLNNLSIWVAQLPDIRHGAQAVAISLRGAPLARPRPFRPYRRGSSFRGRRFGGTGPVEADAGHAPGLPDAVGGEPVEEGDLGSLLAPNSLWGPG